MTSGSNLNKIVCVAETGLVVVAITVKVVEDVVAVIVVKGGAETDLAVTRTNFQILLPKLINSLINWNCPIVA